jgi:hypothetical protein
MGLPPDLQKANTASREQADAPGGIGMLKFGSRLDCVRLFIAGILGHGKVRTSSFS